MASVDEVYVAAQERLLALAAEAGATDKQVPATPDWTVHDVVAHVTGLACDLVAGQMPYLDLLEQWRDDSVANSRDDMTERQVSERRGRSLDDIAAEWRGNNAALLPLLRGEVPEGASVPPFIDSILVTDVHVHEQDVRQALGRDGARDAAGIGIGLATYGFGVGYRIDALGLPALVVRYGDKQRTLGAASPGATVTADKFELFRAFAGRRSAAQIAALDWDGDPAPYLPLIPAYGERADALSE